MENQNLRDRPIAEGLLFGASIVLVVFLWIFVDAFHFLVLLPVYFLGLYCLSISILWYLARNCSVRTWFLDQPVRFFIVGFIEIFFIVGFLDLAYLEDPGDVLVEAHGLVFDLLIFGILLTAFEAIRSTQDRTQRYKEELDDYRGWTEPEAAYRISGIIRRLMKEGVSDIDFRNLHLGKCRKEVIEMVVTAKTRILSIEGAELIGANLIGADFQGANLQNTELRGANLQNSLLERANLQNADLNGANLQNANLWGARLMNASMIGTSFKKAFLVGADFASAKITEINLKDADIRGVKWPSSNPIFKELDGAKVETLDWVEVMKECLVGTFPHNLSRLSETYHVDSAPYRDGISPTYYLIKKKTNTPSPSDLCTAITKSGEQCRRRARFGTIRCYQHQYTK